MGGAGNVDEQQGGDCASRGGLNSRYLSSFERLTSTVYGSLSDTTHRFPNCSPQFRNPHKAYNTREVLIRARPRDLRTVTDGCYINVPGRFAGAVVEAQGALVWASDPLWFLPQGLHLLFVRASVRTALRIRW